MKLSFNSYKLKYFRIFLDKQSTLLFFLSPFKNIIMCNKLFYIPISNGKHFADALKWDIAIFNLQRIKPNAVAPTKQRKVNSSTLSFNCSERQASRCNDRVNRIKSESNVQKFKLVFHCNLQFITVAGLPFVMEIGSFYKLKPMHWQRNFPGNHKAGCLRRVAPQICERMNDFSNRKQFFK